MSKRTTPSLGRHLLPAVAMTAAASGLIALLDRPPSGSAGDLIGDSAASPDQGLPAVQTDPPVVSSTLPAVVPAVVPSGDDGGGDDGEDDGGDGGAPVVSIQPVPQPVPTAAPAPTTTPAVVGGVCEGQTVDGPSVSTRWGPVQVEAVISNSGQICDVDAIRSPDSHRRSVRINQEALPILHDRVMKAQSAKIRTVSGATVTTEGYVTSLQAILDGAGG